MQKITVLILFVLFLTCASRKSLYEHAISNRSIENYEEFLNKYPTGKYSIEIQTYLYKQLELNMMNLFWERNLSLDQKVRQFNDMLEKYPKYEKKIHKYISDTQFTEIKSILNNSEMGNNQKIVFFENFIESYPSSIHIKNAKSAIEYCRYASILKDRSIQNYQEYLEKYPDNKYTAKVENQLFFANMENELRLYDSLKTNSLPSDSLKSIIKENYYKKLSGMASNAIKEIRRKNLYFFPTPYRTADSYIEAGSIYTKMAGLDSLFGLDYVTDYKKSAYLFYLASKCYFMESQDPTYEDNLIDLASIVFGQNTTDPFNSHRKDSELYSAYADYYYKKSAESFSHANMQKLSTDMLKVKNYLAFNFDELDVELGLKK